MAAAFESALEVSLCMCKCCADVMWFIHASGSRPDASGRSTCTAVEVLLSGVEVFPESITVSKYFSQWLIQNWPGTTLARFS